MSGHKYINDSKNLFLDDDVDDNTFLKNARPSSSTYDDPLKRMENQRQTLIEKRREIENSTLRSTQTSLGLLRESEEVGIATAEELHRQREKLESTDKRLDEINATLRFSQKHLNGIKSVFGGLKNYLSGKSDLPVPRATSSSQEPPEQTGRTSSSMHHAVSDPYRTHPLNRIKDCDDLQNQSSDGDNFQKVIDANLQEMLNSTVRLKGLAINLSEEIDSQNDLIDDITYKIDREDFSIQNQNKEINKILKK